jgi:hypothetical protein
LRGYASGYAQFNRTGPPLPAAVDRRRTKPQITAVEKQTTGGLRMPIKSFIADAKSRNAIAVLVWLSFVGMASTVLAQGPLPIPRTRCVPLLKPRCIAGVYFVRE